VSVRARAGGDLGARTVTDFLDAARSEIDTKGRQLSAVA